MSNRRVTRALALWCALGASAALAQGASIVDTPSVSQPDANGVISWQPDPRANDCVVYVDGVLPKGREIPVTPAMVLGTERMTYDTSSVPAGAAVQVSCRLARNVEVASPLSAPIIIASGAPETPEFTPTRTLLDDAEGGLKSAWNQYDADPEGGILGVEPSALFGSSVLHFNGSDGGNGNGWEYPINAAADYFTVRAASAPDNHFSIVFYTTTTTGAQILSWQTDTSVTITGDTLGFFLPAGTNDGSVHSLSLDVRAKLAAAGKTLTKIDKVRVRPRTSLYLDDLAITDSATATPGRASVTFAAVTGDDVLTDAEAAAGITVSGTASGLPSGSRVSLRAHGIDYLAPTGATDWSVAIDPSALGAWGDSETLRASFVDADGVVIESQRIVERYRAGTVAAGMQNTQPNGQPDTRPGVYAFPGATGHAKESRGGRGGKVIKVTTLADNRTAGDGEVTLREALERTGDVTPGAATIVFDVGGIFDFSSSDIIINASSNNTTVACQTAPEPGFVGRGKKIYIKGAQHFVMRHCAWRFLDGDSQAEAESGGFRVTNTGTCKFCLFDHLSISWSPDENFLMFTGGSSSTPPHENVGITHSLIAEGDTTSRHEESGRSQAQARQGIAADYSIGNHSMGIVCDADQLGTHAGKQLLGCSVTANMLMNNWQRNPQMRGARGEIVNNFIVNPGARGLIGYGTNGGQTGDVIVKGNVVKAGIDSSNTVNGYFTLGAARVKYENNKLWTRAGQVQSFADKTDNPNTTLASGDGDAEFNLSCVGASKPSRDNVDQRLVTEANGYTPSSPVLDSAEVGVGVRVAPVIPPCKSGQPCFYEGTPGSNARRDYSYYAAGGAWPASHDTDGDGMADAWESAVGLNVGAADHNGDLDGDGYTNIEEYINGLAVCGS